MRCRIALDPSLQLSPARFAADWNADPRSRTLADAEVQRGSSASYDPALGEIALLLTTQMALAVAGNALYDLIKDILLRQKPAAEQEALRRRITVLEHDGGDGSRTLIVTIDEHLPGA
jgi:hypothetical protein